jgi:hypothetical protein
MKLLTADTSLDIPWFLRRTPANTLAVPRPWGPPSESRPLKAKHERAPNISKWSDARLAAEMDTATVTERQPMIREWTRRDQKERARARIMEMKARLAARE